MIRLFVFPPSLAGTPNPGPFCIKLETALRLAGVAYETCYEPRPDKGPKGKMPFVEIDGERMGDSMFILDHLKKTEGIDLDAHLSPREKAQSHALQRMIEERLNFVLGYSRWLEPENWEKYRPVLFGKMPWPLGHFIPQIVQRQVRKAYEGQGMLRHERDEIYALGVADLATIAEILGDQLYLFGDRPSTADATAYGFLVSIIGPDLESPLKDAALGHTNLVRYCERMGEVFARAGRTRQIQKVAA